MYYLWLTSPLYWTIIAFTDDRNAVRLAYSWPNCTKRTVSVHTSNHVWSHREAAFSYLQLGLLNHTMPWPRSPKYSTVYQGNCEKILLHLFSVGLGNNTRPVACVCISSWPTGQCIAEPVWRNGRPYVSGPKSNGRGTTEDREVLGSKRHVANWIFPQARKLMGTARWPNGRPYVSGPRDPGFETRLSQLVFSLSKKINRWVAQLAN